MSQEFTSNTSSQHELQSNDGKSEKKVNYDWTEMLKLLDYVCCKIADRYALFSREHPRKATIIEVLARNTCIACVDKELRTKSIQRIDNMYTELHQLACSMLIEELYSQLVENGHTVIITTEENIEYGKVDVDVFIVPFNYGLSLYSKQIEIAVEVKTGFGLSLPQLFRYMIDGDRRSLILWRIRNGQVLLFEMTEIKQLLDQFVKMTISRANRLLLTNEPKCKHTTERRSWSPNQQHLQEAFSDFSKGIIKTLPTAVAIILRKIDGDQANCSKPQIQNTEV